MLAGKSLKSIAALSVALIAAGGLTARAQSPYIQTYGKEKAPQEVKTATTSSAGQKGSDGKSTDAKDTGKTATKTAKKKPALIVKPKQHVCAGGGKWEQFADYIVLQPGQELLPLTLGVLNGSSGTKPLRGLRATLAGRDLFKETDFKGKPTLSMDLSNALTSGSTQIIFQAFGAAGSAFKWQISTSAEPSITGLAPTRAGAGDKIKANGKNLPEDKKAITVKVDGQLAEVSKADPKFIEFTVPDKMKTGKDKPVEITISGQKMKTYTLTIAGKPEITSMDMVSVNPGGVLTINGKNFSKDKKEIEVKVNGDTATVSSCSDSSIAIIIPPLDNVPCVLTVDIKVGGVSVPKPGMLVGGQRVIPNDDGYSPFEPASHLL